MKNIRIEIELERERSFELFTAVKRISEAAEEAALAVRTNRAEFLRLMVDVANEMLNSAWSTCRPEWKDCDCGLSGCGDWCPETDAEKEISDRLFQPINKLMYHSRELIESVGFEDSWRKED